MSFYFAKNIIEGGGSFLGTSDSYETVVLYPNPSYKYISRTRSQKVFNVHNNGEIINYSFDFSREAARRGVSVDNVDWSVFGCSLIVGKPYLNAALSVCSLSVGDGNSKVKVICEFTDGSTKHENIEILGIRERFF